MGQCQIIVCFGVSKKGWVKIKPDTLILCPINPWGKVTVFDLVTIWGLVRVQIHRVKIEPVCARDLGIGKLQISSEFIWIARAPRVISSRLNAAAGRSGLGFKSYNVIALGWELEIVTMVVLGGVSILGAPVRFRA